ncbi:hypothetical protein O4H66_23670 [Comamonadaceae bacterium G21597-S1]|nr:hypothetical protein [Comamonadaceae bacterium G21597-S1]
MNRRQRRFHARVWPALALAIAAVVGMALFVDAHVAQQARAIPVAGGG